jgi:hypothetical protein
MFECGLVRPCRGGVPYGTLRTSSRFEATYTELRISVLKPTARRMTNQAAGSKRK